MKLAMHSYYTPLCTLRNLVMILATCITPLTQGRWPWEWLLYQPWWNLCESGQDFPLSLNQPLLIRARAEWVSVPVANDEVSKDKEFSLATFVTVVPWIRYQVNVSHSHAAATCFELITLPLRDLNLSLKQSLSFFRQHSSPRNTSS